MSDLIRGQKGLGAARSRIRSARPKPKLRQPLSGQRPRTPEELARFVEDYFGLCVPRRAMCPHHDSPLDYLTASFFGQEDLLVWANRGGGKTLLAAAATILDAVFRAPLDIRVLGGSFDQSDRLADYIREMLSAHPQLIVGKFTRQRVELAGGSDIRMLAQSQRAVRGQHVQKIRCDEVDLFDGEVWRAVQFATHSRNGARGSIEVLSTLHRPGGLMQDLVGDCSDPSGSGAFRLIRWCLWDVIERCGPERRCENCALADDCCGLAREANGYYPIDDAITAKARSSRAAWEAEMLCKGAHREFQVFAEFAPARHVRPVSWRADWPTYRAIDFGYRNPFVCLWVQVGPDGMVHVIDEYIRSQLPIAQHAEEILRRDPGPVVISYVDPAGRQRESTSGAACTELLGAAGIQCACRGSTIVEGLELIRAALAPASGEPTLRIAPNCRQLIQAFENYHYGEASSRDRDRPVKDGPDHLIDSLRYFYINRMRPNMEVKRGRY